MNEQTLNRIKERRAVIRNAFKTEQGTLALNELVEMFVKVQLFDADPLVTAYRVAQHDLIQLLVEFTEGRSDGIT